MTIPFEVSPLPLPYLTVSLHLTIQFSSFIGFFLIHAIIVCLLASWTGRFMRSENLYCSLLGGKREGGRKRGPVEVLGYTLKVSDFNPESTLI